MDIVGVKQGVVVLQPGVMLLSLQLFDVTDSLLGLLMASHLRETANHFRTCYETDMCAFVRSAYNVFL